MEFPPACISTPKSFVMKVFLASLLLFLALPLCAQTGAVKGTLTDRESAEPVVFATVKLLRNDSLIMGVTSDVDGIYAFNAVMPGTYTLKITSIDYRELVVQQLVVKAGAVTVHNAKLEMSQILLEEIVIRGARQDVAPVQMLGSIPSVGSYSQSAEPQNTESYDYFAENTFVAVTNRPLSTFGIDVDKASYSNVRRFINDGELPPVDAVRIEELINYFPYEYGEPTGRDPFAVQTAVVDCPWNNQHRLVHIGMQGQKIDVQQLPANNLVFLIDVSGSMQAPDKLDLLKSALYMLVEQLRPEDKVSIVVYAGASGLVLPATPGSNKQAILEAIEALQAGGSTAGGAGIELAYKVAQEQFIIGNNRVILATDGDFNVGITDEGALVRLIEQKRQSGIFLSVLGFGTGNLQDSKMEKLADNGNGNYSYIDNLLEAKKVMVSEMGGTLLTIAKDVKLQLEFNPAQVKGYRLIGYENRLLADEDFNNDAKDAGDLGAGHSVTAIYEIIPAGSGETVPGVDELKYQKQKQKAGPQDELLTLKLRYKLPQSAQSKLLTHIVKPDLQPLDQASADCRFSIAVAEFGMLLRESGFKGTSSFAHVLELAQSAKGSDVNGYRAEFIELVKAASGINP